MQLFPSSLTSKVQSIIDKAIANNLKIACAESCTGGLLSTLLTETPGASTAFDRGFVTYSPQSKIEVLSVQEAAIEQFGPVSEEVAKQMAIGALKGSCANIALSITGIAGPDSDETGKPVGLVYIGLATKAENSEPRTSVRKFNFSGNRSEVRKSALMAALDMIERTL